MSDSFSNRLTSWTFHGLLLFLPLIFTTTNDELFEFPKMLCVYAGALLILGALLWRTAAERKVTITRTSFDIPILIFLGSQLLSTIFSISPHTSLFGYYSRFNGGFLSVLSYVMLFYGFVSTVDTQSLPKYFRSLILGGVFAALYAFPEHFGVSPSCYLITGELSVTCWVQDVQSRVFGTLGQPNWLAAYMVVLLPIVAAQYSVLSSQFSEKMRKLKLIGPWILVFGLFTSVLFFTKSRSGILGAGVALGIYILLNLILQIRSSQLITHKRRQAVAALVPIALFTFLLLVISNPVGDKIQSILRLSPATSHQSLVALPSGTQLESGGSESGDIRKVVWSGALAVWKRYPVLGSGVETFAYSYYKDRPQAHNLLSEWDFLYNKAHNEFLNYLATTGTIGFLSYVMMYGSFVVLPIIWIIKNLQQEENSAANYSPLVALAKWGQLSAVSSALTGLAVSNFFGFSTVVVSLLTFLLPAFAIVLAGKTYNQVIALPQFLRRKFIQKVLFSIIGLTTFYTILCVIRMYDIDREFATAKVLIGQNEVADGIAHLQSAVERMPEEPIYRDELAYTAARVAYALGTSGESTRAATLSQAAINYSDSVLAQNPNNVNFYKTRIRIFNLLGELSPVFYDEAIKTIQTARNLSPTDPKLPYNLALLYKQQDKMSEYEAALRETVRLRPIDEQAQLDLAILEEASNRTDQALQEYQKVLQLNPKNPLALERIASISGKKKE